MNILFQSKRNEMCKKWTVNTKQIHPSIHPTNQPFIIKPAKLSSSASKILGIPRADEPYNSSNRFWVYTPGAALSYMWLKDQREAPRRFSNHLPKPPQLTASSSKEHQLESKPECQNSSLCFYPLILTPLYAEKLSPSVPSLSYMNDCTKKYEWDSWASQQKSF